MNIVKFCTIWLLLLNTNYSFGQIKWSSVNWNGKKISFRNYKNKISISKSKKSLNIILNKFPLLLEVTEIKKLSIYKLRKVMRAFKKKLREKKVKLIRITGPVKSRTRYQKITLWEYRFSFRKDQQRFDRSEFFFRCGKSIMKLSYNFNKRYRSRSRLRFDLRRLVSTMKCGQNYKKAPSK